MYHIGKKAEESAAEFLEGKGYKIHFKNYRFGRLEIDLVCEYEGQIIVVEVKSLRSLDFKNPYEAVSKPKQRRIVKVADYLLNHCFPGRECRFDIVSIFLAEQEAKIEHITNAFVPEMNSS
tara:strand:- start:73 stop:435 length:363 start_codon:yes stop_codon:yes gene_type:complete